MQIQWPKSVPRASQRNGVPVSAGNFAKESLRFSEINPRSWVVQKKLL
jgi:hypothetical protein